MLKLCVSRNVFIQLVIILIYLFQSILLFFFDVTGSYITLLQYELLAIYIWSIYSAVKESGFLNVYVIFLSTLGLFLYSRIFLDILGLFEWYWATKWSDFYFPLVIRYRILSFLIYTLLFTHLGALLGKRYLVYKQIEFSYSPFLDKWSTILFLLAVPGTFTKYLIELKLILSRGYLAVYDGTLNNIVYPLWTVGAGTLMESAYCLFLASRPTKKKFFIISIVFFMLKMVDVLKGGRSRLFLPVIFLAWYYYSFLKNNSSISLKKILLFGFGGIFIAQVLVQFRMGDDIIIDNMGDLIILFFAQQGVSLLVLGCMVYYEPLFVNQGAPYILYPLIFWDSFHGQTVDYVQNTISLGHKLTYFLSPEAYLNGEGVGSSYIGEFWDLGWIGAIILSFVLGYGIRYFEKIVRKSRVIMYLAFILVPTIVYMPRASFFPSLKQILISLIFYYVITTIWVRRTNYIVSNCENR